MRTSNPGQWFPTCICLVVACMIVGSACRGMAGGRPVVLEERVTPPNQGDFVSTSRSSPWEFGYCLADGEHVRIAATPNDEGEWREKFNLTID